MKKCTIGWFSKIVTFLVFMIFFAPLTIFSIYMTFFYPQASSNERLLFLVGIVMFGSLVAFFIYRMFYLGLVWVEYDSEKVIFHYSRKKEYKFDWKEIPERVQVEHAGGGYVFYIQDNGKKRKIPVNHLSKGFKDFEKTLELTGVLHRISIKTQEEFKKDAEQTLSQFFEYVEANPNSIKPKPKGNCVICSDCHGKGLRIKNIPFLKINVGKVCKTCGGSGYLPK